MSCDLRAARSALYVHIGDAILGQHSIPVDAHDDMRFQC